MNILPSVYNPFGEIVSNGRNDRPDLTSEQHAALRAADRVGYRALLAERGWTVAQFEAAQRYAFPQAVTRVFGRDGSTEAVYSRSAVSAWAGALAAFAKTLK